MAKEIEPRQKLIKDYLQLGKNELFVVPEYQRSYSWTTAECDKLWQDIEAFRDSNESEPYFFGTVIADCSKPNRLCLIDGQQRTTTFILLFRALLLRISDLLKVMSHDEESESLRDGLKDRRNTILDCLYKTEAEDRGLLLKDWSRAKGKTILKSESINELENCRQELQNIDEAKDYEEAEKSCYKIPRRQKDNKYTNFFRNFKFFLERLKTYEGSQVNAFARTFLEKCQIIEIRSWNTEQAITMFNSLNSTGMPLSDSDIISAKLYANASATGCREGFMEKWEGITSAAGSLELDKVATLDALFQQLMYIKRAESNEYMKGGTPDVSTPGLRRYYTEQKADLLKDPLGLCSNLENLVQAWDFAKDIPVVRLLLKFNENAKLFFVSYLNRCDLNHIDMKDLELVTESLVRLFSILELVDTGYSSKDFKMFLFGENTRLVDPNVSAVTIANDFSQHIKDNRQWTKDSLRELLLDYDKNAFVFLNEYLYAKEHGLDFRFSHSVNVEHIMPASGHNIVTIRHDAKIANAEEFKRAVNKLGNKILLEEDINKSISNDWFKTKKQKSVRDKSGYKDSIYPIAQSLVDYRKNVWTKEDIDAATSKAADRIVSFIFS